MTLFRMLPVRCGDAYLLKSRRGSYLIDGGSQGGYLPDMLHERSVGKLRAAVCSFPCNERLGGILDLMEADYRVSEYWLPEWVDCMPALARRFNRDWRGWLDQCGWPMPFEVSAPVWSSAPVAWSGDWIESAAGLVALGVAAATGQVPSGQSGPSQIFKDSVAILTKGVVGEMAARTGGVGGALRILGRSVWEVSGVEGMALLCGHLLHHLAGNTPNSSSKRGRSAAGGLALAVMALALTSRLGQGIRFFRQTGRFEEYLVPRHPLRVVNGVQVPSCPPVEEFVTPEALFAAACHPYAQGKGLVLQYGEAECGALLCGDTTLSFLKRSHSLPLNRPTVIAAPRQGSASSQRVYDCIHSEDPASNIWLRSHVSYSRKVADAFKEQPNKLCLNNCAYRTVQEVLLSFTDGKWKRLAGTPCLCE